MAARTELHKPTVRMLRVLWRHYRKQRKIRRLNDIFRMAYQENIGDNASCAETDFRIFTSGDPNPPEYLQRAYIEHSAG